MKLELTFLSIEFRKIHFHCSSVATAENVNYTCKTICSTFKRIFNMISPDRRTKESLLNFCFKFES